MNDYTSLLTHVANRADPTSLPAPERIRAAVARRRRRGGAFAAVVAIAAIGAGAVVLGSGPSRQEPAPAVNTPALDPSTGPLSSAYGEPVTVQPGLPHLDLHAVNYHEAQGGGRSVYIVVGDSSADALHGDEAVPHPIWWSDDARTWHHATTGPAESNVWDVTASGGGSVAVAPHGAHSSTAWCSANGDQWFQADVPDDFHVFAVSATDAGYFAWDGNNVFRSGGCSEWTRLANAPDLTGKTVCFVEEVDGQVVLGASPLQGRPSAWVLDGDAWRSRPSLTSLGDDWCRQHETAQSSTEGPAGTVSVNPGGNHPNTVFIKQD